MCGTRGKIIKFSWSETTRKNKSFLYKASKGKVIGYCTADTNTFIFWGGAITPLWVLATPLTRFGFLDHTQRHTTVDRTPLEE
jgi:hypothetical protein